MSNSKRGAVSFTVDSKPCTLRMSFNAMCSYQEAQGRSVLDALGALEADPGDFILLRGLFHMALEQDGAGAEDAGEIMSDLGLGESARLLGEAAKAAFPEISSSAGDGGPGKPIAARKPRKKT